MLDTDLWLFDSNSGSTVNIGVALEREDEVSGPVIAPLFPQVAIFISKCVLHIIRVILFYQCSVSMRSIDF